MVKRVGGKALVATVLSAFLLNASAVSVDISKHMYAPAGQCLIYAGRLLTNLETHLTTAAAADDPIVYASQNLSGPVTSIALAIQTIGFDDVWHITGALRDQGCGILSGATLSCYMVDPCANKIGAETSYTCNQSWWNELDSGLNQVSCHLTLKPSNVDMFADHPRICAGLTQHLVQGRSFFDVVSADGVSECDLF